MDAAPAVEAACSPTRSSIRCAASPGAPCRANYPARPGACHTCRLPADGQRRILHQISLLADHDFAGRVQRPFMTAMYTGRLLDRNA